MSAQTVRQSSTASSLPKVFINVLTWNRPDAVISALLSLNALTYENYTVIVIDNDSQDDTVERLSKMFPDLKIIVNSRNLGYTGGHNVGIHYALQHGADFIMMLNNDAAVHPRLIENLLRVAVSDPTIAVVGPKNLHYGSQIMLWASWGELTYGALLTRVCGRNKFDGPPYWQVRDVDQVIGNGYMWRREALEDIGLLDENFFGYHEDVDWCYRAAAKGWRVVYVGDAIVYHKGSLSGNSSYRKFIPVIYFLGRNGVLFTRKHNGFWRLCQLSVNMVLGSVGRLISKRSNLSSERQFWRGFWDGLLGRNTLTEFRN